MKNKLTHFAIHADNVDRAKEFYDIVFNWNSVSYGQADFLQIMTREGKNSELIGALQSRKYSPVDDRLIGLECTIGVENIEEVIEKVKEHGGKILMPKTEIPEVGWITKFLDTEGNLICAMQYKNLKS